MFHLRLLAYQAGMVLEVLYLSKIRFRLWRLERQGRRAEVEALVHRTGTEWGHRIFRMLNCRVEVIGGEHLPQTGPLIVMANHQSAYDIPLLVGYLGRLSGFVAKKELYRVPGMAYWLRRLHCLPLDRSDVTQTGRVLREFSARTKAHGRSLIIFPEGTRTRAPGAAVQRFRQGSLRLATFESLPILPVSLDGTHLLHDPGAMAGTREGGRLVRLKIAPVQRPAPANSRESQAFMAALRETIVSNREAIRVEWPVPEARAEGREFA